MKFVEQHYEKLALGVGVATVAAALFFSWSAGSSTTKLISNNNGKGGVGVIKSPIDTKRLSKVSSLVDEKVSIRPTYIEGSEQETFLMQSIPLLGKEGSKIPFDPLNPSAPRIHSKIPNAKWYEWALVEDMFVQNGPELDPDKDGYTTLEEFVAETNPNDIKSHPNLLKKLEAEGVEVSVFSLKFTGGGEDYIYLKLQDSSRGVNADEKLSLNEVGPTNKGKLNDPNDFKKYKDRFKLLKMFRKEGVETIELEDQSGTKKKYEVSRRNALDVDDRVAILFLNALGQSDAPGKKLAAGSTFALPFDGEDKRYRVDSIKLKQGSESEFEIKVTDTKTKETKTLEAFKK